MKLLEGLNAEQRQAVTHGEGPLLVVAGAGTGKTQVITRRIAHLIETKAAEPGEVLALTFTEKAAREMAERLYDLIGWQSFQVPVMTFNAFGAELLGRYASHIGRSIRGGLINETQKTLLLKQRFEQIELEYYGLQPDLIEFLERVVEYIGKLQNAGVTPGGYEDYVAAISKQPGDLHQADIAEQHDLAKLYRLYEDVKFETGTFDYHDQLALPLRILHDRPNLAERLAGQYKYVLVDEYQDTSPVQDALLRAFIPADGNLFAVGDDDQAIYGFRGAEIGNILKFTEHFSVKQPAALVQNYRSGQPILDAAYRLIRHNDPNRLEVELGLNKRLLAQTDQALVKFQAAADPAAEQQMVVEEVAARIAGGESPNQIAVLARSNAVLRGYARALRAAGLPFAVSTEINVFEQRELIHLWYLLQWIDHRATDESIGHLLLGPFFGWTAAECRRIIQRASAELTDLESVIRSEAKEGDNKSRQLVGRIDNWRGWAADDSVSRMSYRLVFETGLADRLIEQGQEQPRIIRVFEDLHLLLTHMQDFEVIETDASLAAYLATFPKPPQLDASEAVGDPDGVQLLTVHASKGLEFDAVYLVGCSAKAWAEPPATGLVVPESLKQTPALPAEHEQRRLMYVAATRARRELMLSAPTVTAGGNKSTLSPLVTELLGDEPVLEAAAGGSRGEEALRKLQRFYPLQSELPDRLPFETADGWLELGVGDLALYANDPHDFYIQKVLKISQPFGPQLSFGSAIHGAIQAYYEAILRDEAVDLALLHTTLDEMWSDRGYDNRSQAELARNRAHETIKRFFEREQAVRRRVKSAEQPVRLELPDIKLRLKGRLDATFELDEGLEVRDFKTGHLRDQEAVEKRIKDAGSREAFQLRTYALAVEHLTGKPPAKVTLDYVVTGAEGSVSLTSRVLVNHRDKLGALAERIRARDFAPLAASAFHQPAAYRYWGTEEDEVENAG